MTWLIALGILIGLTAFAPALTAAGFATIGGTILAMAAKLLDISLYALVTKFDLVIYNSLAPVINQLWTVFRDIANIVIIGMFTFIALSMILGIEKFNARQMVAKVLLIAVLINFSLLFTRIIIVSSNFVAGQFYCSMIANTGQSGVCGSGASPRLTDLAFIGSNDSGIGREFMKFLGADTFLNAWDTAKKVYDANNWYSANFLALLYGLMTAGLFLAAALVFAYIVFLLVARSILFLFLLVMSAPAFASYLIPGKGDHYWSVWWNALLQNAIFAPLLMMMLWATFLTSRGLVETVGKGRSFDALFTNQESGSGYLALLIFAIILGMLYASARFASSFAKGIDGFDWGTMAAGIPLALGGRLAGFVGRNTLGAYFAGRSARMAGKISETNTAIGKLDPNNRNYERRKTFLENRLSDLGAKKRFADKIADRKYSVADTKRGAAFLKSAGVPESVIGGGKRIMSYGEFQKKTTKEAAEQAAELTKLSKDNIRAVQKAATGVLEQQKTAIQANIVAAERNRQAEETARRAEFDKLENDMRRYQANYDTWQRTRPPGPGRDADLNKEKVKIENTQKQINELRAQIRKNAGLDRLESQLHQIDQDIKNTAAEAVVQAQENARAVGRNLAGASVPWAKGGNLANPQTVQMARSAYDKKVGESQEEQRIKDVLKAYVGSSGTPPTPPTP